MSDEPDIVEDLDRATFDSFKLTRGGPPSAQATAVREMEHGDTIALTHEGYAACPGKKCSLVGTIRYGLRERRPDAVFEMKHLPDGRLAVACFAKEDQP